MDQSLNHVEPAYPNINDESGEWYDQGPNFMEEKEDFLKFVMDADPDKGVPDPVDAADDWEDEVRQLEIQLLNYNASLRFVEIRDF